MPQSYFEITLSWAELAYAAWVGARRQIDAMIKGKEDSFGYDGSDGWTKHIEGAAGECALAKYLGVYWGAPVGTFKTGGDVGEIQVRTRSRHDYELLIRPQDRDEDTFVLLTGVAPSFRAHGWIQGQDAKKKEWLQTYGGRPPAYFVPQKDLRPLLALKGSPV